MDTLRKEIIRREIELGIRQETACTEEENKQFANALKNGIELPDEIVKPTQAGEEFYKYERCDLSGEEIRALLLYRQTAYQNTIKNCVLFFTVTAFLFLLLSVLSFL